MNQDPSTSSTLVWPHRFAMLMVCATYPLIWVGGLVTTTKAGMAVPDWPSTYGYNLFLYPWETWVFGPFDLFIEHGHRVLGAVVGLIAIGFLVSVFFSKGSKTLLIFASVALLAVITQGILGGARVIQDEVLLAKIHGCFGPAFFMFAIFLEIITSHRFQLIKNQSSNKDQLSAHAQTNELTSSASGLQRLSVSTMAFAYLQLVLGAQLRHISPMSSHGDFRIAVVFHVLVAFVVLIHVFLLTRKIWLHSNNIKPLKTISLLASIVVSGQIMLGIATWTTKYHWPTFLPGGEQFASYLIYAESFFQTMIITAHVATGSLILGLVVTIVVYCFGYFPINLKHLGFQVNNMKGVVA